MNNCFSRYYLPTALLLALLFCLLRFNTIPVGTFFDDAHYLILAESLATGSGYNLINFPDMRPEQAFPPGWPLLLTPIVALFPGNLILPKLMTLFFALGSIWLADLLFRHRLSAEMRPWFLILMATNPLFVGTAGTVMSEPAYMFFSLLVLVLIQKAFASEGAERLNLRSISWGILILGLALFGVMTRTVGLSLLIAAVIGLIPKKRWGWVFVGGGGLGILVWLIARFAPELLFLSPTYAGHVEYLSSEISSYLQFWVLLPQFDWPLIGNVMFPVLDLSIDFVPLWSQLSIFFGVLIFVTILAGWVHQLINELNLTEIYFLLFLLIFYFWTAYISEVQQRQLAPMIPFFAFYLVTIIYVSWQKLTGKDNRFVGLVFSIFLVLFFARNIFEWINPVSDKVVNYSIAGEWLRENTNEDAIFAVNYPVPSFLYARRLTEYLPADLSSVNFDAYVADKDISYLVFQPDFDNWHLGELDIRPQYRQKLIPHLDKNPDQYQLVFSDADNNVFIYQVLKK